MFPRRRSGVFRLNLQRDVLRYLFVVIELHSESGAPLRHGTQRVDVTEHVGKRLHRVDDVGVAAHVLALNMAAPRVEIANDGASVFRHRHDLDLHDRLEQHRAALLQRLAQGAARADFERQRRRIDVVIAAVDQRHLEIDHREAGEQAGTEHRFETLLDAGDEFLRHRAADNFVLEYKTATRRQRFADDLDLGELPSTAGLLLVLVIDRYRPRDLLAISDLRRADIGIDLVGAPEDVDLDVEMQLAHATDDGLTRLRIGVDAE